MLIFGMTPHSHMYFDFEHHIISMYSVDDRIHLTQPKHSTGLLLYLAHSAGPWPKSMGTVLLWKARQMVCLRIENLTCSKCLLILNSNSNSPTITNLQQGWWCLASECTTSVTRAEPCSHAPAAPWLGTTLINGGVSAVKLTPLSEEKSLSNDAI